MKKSVACLLTVILVLSLVFSIDATAPYSSTNPCTAENFDVTLGYTVYGIFANPNVKLYYFDGDKEKEVVNRLPSTNGELLSPDTPAFQGFRDLWYSYDGYCLAILKDAGIMEIKFHGTAINLGIVLYRATATSQNMSAHVTIDGTEYIITSDAMIPPNDNLNDRLVCPRYFQVSGLNDGWHTLRLKSTGTERFLVEYYEIIETAPAPAPIEYKAVQESVVIDGKFNIRLVATVDNLDFETVGFDVIANYSEGEQKEFHVNCTYVYNKLTGKTETGIVKEYTATELGGNYLMALAINNIPDDLGLIILTVTPYAVLNGEKILGDTYTVKYLDGQFQSMEKN